MQDYAIFVSDPAKREIKKLSRQAQAQVVKAIGQLAKAPRPHGIEKLKANPSCYRLRSGDYRVIYSVREEKRIIIILVVRDRKDAFKGLEALDGKLANALIKIADAMLERSAADGAA